VPTGDGRNGKNACKGEIWSFSKSKPLCKFKRYLFDTMTVLFIHRVA